MRCNCNEKAIQHTDSVGSQRQHDQRTAIFGRAEAPGFDAVAMERRAGLAPMPGIADRLLCNGTQHPQFRPTWLVLERPGGMGHSSCPAWGTASPGCVSMLSDACLNSLSSAAVGVTRRCECRGASSPVKTARGTSPNSVTAACIR